MLFASDERPNLSTNKIAPKLQVDFTSSSATGADAKLACEGRGGDWRLPTQREMLLIYSLGGSDVNFNTTFSSSLTTWPTGFNKISGWHWTMTESATNKNWVFVNSSNEFVQYSSDRNDTGLSWVNYRCVRTVQ